MAIPLKNIIFAETWIALELEEVCKEYRKRYGDDVADEVEMMADQNVRKTIDQEVDKKLKEFRFKIV